MGYEGHVWSHGHDWVSRKKQVHKILLGEPGWQETARTLGVRYLFWGEIEAELFPDSEEPWRTDNLQFASGPWGALYDLQSPRPNPATDGPPDAVDPGPTAPPPEGMDSAPSEKKAALHPPIQTERRNLPESGDQKAPSPPTK